EQSLGRRQIRFRRKIEGSMIFLSSEPVTPMLGDDDVQDDRGLVCSIFHPPRPNHLSYHEKPCLKDAYFITSADMIDLAEFLLDFHFSIEEKLRIWKVLEAFHPIPVTTTIQSPGSFRRKDLELFTWDVLVQALESIIQKYVCSPRIPCMSTTHPSFRHFTRTNACFSVNRKFVVTRPIVSLLPSLSIPPTS
ncbi:uncharacterized protein EI90DRAFT_2918062, partial [Cantharellus anzutake]|uniref:uncharacterized protein n=1 Tax=Cantharellus anzutake TaxID=1750568 RepID=UPI0019072253